MDYVDAVIKFQTTRTSDKWKVLRFFIPDDLTFRQFSHAVIKNVFVKTTPFNQKLICKVFRSSKAFNQFMLEFAKPLCWLSFALILKLDWRLICREKTFRNVSLQKHNKMWTIFEAGSRYLRDVETHLQWWSLMLLPHFTEWSSVNHV